MLSVKKVKELLEDKTLSDEEVEEIRDGYRNLAEVIFEHYQNEKNKNSNKK